MTPRSILALLWCVAASAAACEAEELAPARPPVCEPSSELENERSLKQGWYKLYVGQLDGARESFERVLKLDGGDHPQARNGLRQVAEALSGARPLRDKRPRGGVVLLAGRPLRVDVPVNTERYRFEEEDARRKAAKALDVALPGPEPEWFRPRTDAEEHPIADDDPDAAAARIDLIVLHDTHTQTARESFVRMVAKGPSTHLTIDYDGTVLQNLDLALEANHTGTVAIDRRSIAIDLVNPLSDSSPPLPPGVTADRREMSPVTRVQDADVMNWGYTAAQMKSLVALVRGLARALPRLSASLPVGRDGVTPRAALPPEEARAVTGVVGHLHLTRRAADPGAGFDWAAFGSALE
jgi:N-acetyl-anhydromuramyl-L-alanine amidase AmpD